MGKQSALTAKVRDQATQPNRFSKGLLASIPDDVLADIVQITHVRQSARIQAGLDILFAVQIASHTYDRYRIDFGAASIRSSLRLVWNAALKLAESLNALDEPAGHLLCTALSKKDWRQRPTIPDCVSLARYIERGAKDALDVSSYGFRKNRRGAPRGTRNYPFQLLLSKLKYAIEIQAAGRLTYERLRAKGDETTGRGTLVDVLELLRPHVVDGLIPSPLPWRLLEDLTSRKIRK